MLSCLTPPSQNPVFTTEYVIQGFSQQHTLLSGTLVPIQISYYLYHTLVSMLLDHSLSKTIIANLIATYMYVHHSRGHSP